MAYTIIVKDVIWILAALIREIDFVLALILGGALGGCARHIIREATHPTDGMSLPPLGTVLLGIIASIGSVLIIPIEVQSALTPFQFCRLVAYGIVAGMMGEAMLRRIRDAVYPEAEAAKQKQNIQEKVIKDSIDAMSNDPEFKKILDQQEAQNG